MFMTRIISFISKPVIIGLIGTISLAGIYVKGRLDGWNSCQEKGFQKQNEQLIEALKKTKTDLQKDIQRIEKDRKKFIDLNQTLNERLQKVLNEIPENDTICNYPDGAADSLRDSIEDANRAAFSQSSDRSTD